MRPLPVRFAHRQRGIGLIEVLIAMLVVVIGVLGISRMQIAMLRNNQSSLLRSQASLLAYDMIDRLRADREAALDGSYAHALGNTSPSAATVPGREVSAWLGSVNSTLPAGTGAIALNGRDVQVTVRWDDTRGREAPLTFTTVVEL
jgi:type IV pilus assembly protein PilV